MTEYLLLDNAHIEALMTTIYQLEPAPEFDWLFAATAYAELKETGPVLLKAQPHTELRKHFDTHWAGHAGWLLASSVPMETLAGHLRSLVHVRCGDARLLFRFYDPRVIRLWLEDASQTEINSLMGPVEKMYLVRHNEELPAYQNESQQKVARSYASEPWLHISRERLNKLAEARKERFDERLVTHLEQHFPQQLDPLSAQQRRGLATGFRESAYQYGFTEAQQVVRWSNLAVMLGSEFPEGDSHRIYQQILATSTLSQEQQLEAMLEQAYRQLLIQEKRPS